MAQETRLLTDAERNAEAKARAADSGTDRYDELLITGNGQTNDKWKGDAVDTIAEEWIRENGPEAIAAVRADYARRRPGYNVANKSDFEIVRSWIIRVNNLGNSRALDCEDKVSMQPTVYRGTTIKVPEGNEITNLLWAEKCPKPLPPVPSVPAPEPELPAPPPPPAPVTLSSRPVAQWTPFVAGSREFSDGITDADFFTGEPPKNPAADGRSRPDRRRGDRLAPGYAEGVNVIEGGTSIGPIRVGGDRFNYRRAGYSDGSYGEVVYSPSALWHVDPATGRTTRPNRRFPQKMEDTFGQDIDATTGAIIATRRGSALISEARRLNPYHGNLFTDDNTATNFITTFNHTGDGPRVLTMFAGIHRAYEPIADRFFGKGDQGPATAEDAEKLLQLNVQLALNPVVWSVNQFGAPVSRPEVIGAAMENIFNDPRFATLPAADQERLRTTYQPLIAQVGNPNELERLVGGREGIKAMYNPLVDWARERADLPFIQRGYWDGIDRPDRPRRPSREDRRAGTEEYGATVAAVRVRDAAVRAPRPFELDFGMGRVQSTERQAPDRLASSRLQMLETLINDDAALDASLEHILNTPGALQMSMTDTIFMSTRMRTSNREFLGFRTDAEADRFAESMGSRLGGRAFRERMDYDGDPVSFIPKNLINLVTLGQAYPGKARNLNQGITDKDGNRLEEAALARFNDPATRGEVRQAYREYLVRAAEAERRGSPVAGTGVALALSQPLAELRGTDATTYVPVRAALEARGVGTVPNDQAVLNINTITSATAGIEAELERRAAAGEPIRRAEDATLVAARDAALAGTAMPSEILSSEAAAAAGVAPGTSINSTVTAFDPTAALNARSQVELAGVLATANNAGIVSQQDVDRHTVTSLASASPEAFSMLMARTLADRTGGREVQAGLRAAIETIDSGHRQHSRYADLIDKVARDLRAASDPAARAAAEAKGMEAFAGFFADSEKAGERRMALSMLAANVSKDGALKATLAEGYRSILAGAGAEQNSFLALLSEDQKAAFLALKSEAGSPEELKAKMEEFLAGNEELRATMKAKHGFSWKRIVQAIVILTFPKPPETPDSPPIVVNPRPECLIEPRLCLP